QLGPVLETIENALRADQAKMIEGSSGAADELLMGAPATPASRASLGLAADVAQRRCARVICSEKRALYFGSLLGIRGRRWGEGQWYHQRPLSTAGVQVHMQPTGSNADCSC